MKTVTLTIKVQVPEDTDEKAVARAIDNQLDEGEPNNHLNWGEWRVGKTVITRPRVDRTKGR